MEKLVEDYIEVVKQESIQEQIVKLLEKKLELHDMGNEDTAIELIDERLAELKG